MEHEMRYAGYRRAIVEVQRMGSLLSPGLAAKGEYTDLERRGSYANIVQSGVG